MRGFVKFGNNCSEAKPTDSLLQEPKVMVPPTKRRRIEPTAVEEINFDLAARHDFLTGFHKRKLQRAKHAQEAAERRARAERIAARKKVRKILLV